MVFINILTSNIFIALIIIILLKFTIIIIFKIYIYFSSLIKPKFNCLIYNFNYKLAKELNLT